MVFRFLVDPTFRVFPLGGIALVDHPCCCVCVRVLYRGTSIKHPYASTPRYISARLSGFILVEQKRTQIALFSTRQ